MASQGIMWPKTVSISACALLLLAVLTPLAAHAETDLSEYEVKAGFIYNFAKLVDWPPSPNAQPTTISLCIFRHSPLADATGAIAGKSANNRTLVVRTINSPAELKNCQIVFISRENAANLDEILGSTRGNPILTVGDTAGLAERGVIINFYPEQDAVRFEINVDSANRAGLKISSRLLNLSRVVHDKGAQP